MTQTAAAAEIQREVHIEAPPSTVYSYFTDPGKLVLWMGNRA